jgi:hypothetical protein
VCRAGEGTFKINSNVHGTWIKWVFQMDGEWPVLKSVM